MIDHLSTDKISEEVKKYQEHHKHLAEGLLKNDGGLSPVMTVLVFNAELEDFQYLVVPIDNEYFESKQAKQVFVHEVIPHNLSRMMQQKLVPTAMSMSMEATMRTGTSKDSMESALASEPQDILIHSFETLASDTVEIFKMHKKDVKVVNPDGDVVDEFELEKVDFDDDNAQMGGLFSNILKNFHKSYTEKP